jgi:hypothetical protein
VLSFEEKLENIMNLIPLDKEDLLTEAFEKMRKDLNLKGFYFAFEEGSYDHVITRGFAKYTGTADIHAKIGHIMDITSIMWPILISVVIGKHY